MARNQCWLLLGLLILFVSPISTFAFQRVDIEDLVSRTRSESTTRAKLFIGLSARSRKTISNRDKSETHADVYFSLSKPQQWRSDLTTKLPDGQQVHVVSARNGELCFNATQNTGHDFELGLIGREKDLQSKFESCLLNQFPFVVVPKTVMSLPLEDFLSTPRLTATWISDLDDHQNRPVEGIKFRIVNPTGVVFGELHWLPNDGFLLRRILVEAEVSKTEGNAIVQKSADQTVEYNTIGEQLLPWSIISKHESGRTTTHQISNLGDAVADQNYYSPESIALNTPVHLISK